VDIKSTAAALDIAVKNLPAAYEETQKLLHRVLDDLKYISPVNHGMASELEAKIAAALAILFQGCEAISFGGSPTAFETEAQKLALLVKQRKLLRN
jgi:hypothetical protein